MDSEGILLELIKDSRQTIREIQARVYSLASALPLASFAVTAFAVERDRPVASVTMLADAVIVALLLYLRLRLSREHRMARLCLERQEAALIALIEGRPVSAQDVVAPLLDLKAQPHFSPRYDAALLWWAALVVALKAAAVWAGLLG